MPPQTLVQASIVVDDPHSCHTCTTLIPPTADRILRKSTHLQIVTIEMDHGDHSGHVMPKMCKMNMLW